ncbi:MAG: DUF2147 domain-containing protein [Flavobacteriales bacterium]|nr:DUF2147 domain-containing protein [Flavobacteriales bacterium]
MRNFLALISLISVPLFAQDISGRWTTIDDNTGAKRSVVEITITNGIASGTIVDIHDKTKMDNTCTKCTDDRKDKRILGLPIIRNMKKDGDEWEDGTILDPENGKIYDCKIWLEDGKLQVRGYVAFFYRTQVWVR